MTTTSTVTDEAVELAAQAYNDAVQTDAFGDVGDEQHCDAMQAALEAAVPLLAPQPMVDREQIARALHDAEWPGCDREHVQYADGVLGDQADAVLALINATLVGVPSERRSAPHPKRMG